MWGVEVPLSVDLAKVTQRNAISSTFAPQVLLLHFSLNLKKSEQKK